MTGPELLTALRAARGTQVRLRAGSSVYPAERIEAGVDRVKLYHGANAMSRDYVIERLLDFSLSSERRFRDYVKGGIPQENTRTFLPIVEVVDEDGDGDVIWATLHLRRTELVGVVFDPLAATRPRSVQSMIRRDD